MLHRLAEAFSGVHQHTGCVIGFAVDDHERRVAHKLVDLVRGQPGGAEDDAVYAGGQGLQVLAFP